MNLRWIALTTCLTLLLTSIGLWIEQSLSPPTAAEASVIETAPATVIQPLIQVLITGAVNKPGVYKLPQGCLKSDLIEKAGGLNNAQALSQEELFKPLKAGQVIHIPVQVKTEPKQPATIDLNTANLEALQRLNGIGPALAQRILDYRKQHGAFKKTEDLLKVKGIGPAKLNKIKESLS